MKWLLVILLLLPLAFAHDSIEHFGDPPSGDQDHIGEEVVVVVEPVEEGVYVLPFGYFSEGRWVVGLFFVVLWLLVIYSLLRLALPLLVRMFSFK